MAIIGQICLLTTSRDIAVRVEKRKCCKLSKFWS